MSMEQVPWNVPVRRRTVLAGLGVAGAGATLGTRLVGSGPACADPGLSGRAADRDRVDRALVVVFLRGGMDGLSAVVPAFEPDLYSVRPTLAVPRSLLIPADRGFGLHPALAPLAPYWRSGLMAAVHAVATRGSGRSHPQAQECVEQGGSGLTDRWVDRLAGCLGGGGVFRSVAVGSVPVPWHGGGGVVGISGSDHLVLCEDEGVRARSMLALSSLYADLDHPIASMTRTTLDTISAAGAASSTPSTSVAYPMGAFAAGLKDIAWLMRAGLGLRVATVDLEGWDLHAGMGGPDCGRMRDQLSGLAGALAAFCQDLGPRLDDVTVVVLTEFGRQVAQNASGGTDHGGGGVMLLLGGGLNGGRVHGAWPGLAAATVGDGALVAANDHRDILAELVGVRLGVGPDSGMFPGYHPRNLGVFRAS